MSKQEDKKQTAREPQPLSREYHSAHKQVMLWSGVLFIWELVGIDLSKAEKSGGYFGGIISSIKSPQAIPWVFLMLVVYFLFKFTIEWYQCNLDRRTLRVARIDFVSVWLISGLAFMLYVGQRISQIQIADLLLDKTRTISLLLGLAFSAMATFLGGIDFETRRGGKRRFRRRFWIMTSVWLVGTFAVTLWLFRFELIRLKLVFLSVIAGVCILQGVRLIKNLLPPKNAPPTLRPQKQDSTPNLKE